MSRRAWNVVAGSVSVLLSVAAGFVAGTIRSADATVHQPGRNPPKVCWHDATSVYRCLLSDSSQARSAEFGPALPSYEIQEISLTIRPRVGRAITVFFPPTADAIFLGRFPVENMLLRYYEGTKQRARADSLRREILSWQVLAPTPR
jgi:hypothetical protein